MEMQITTWKRDMMASTRIPTPVFYVGVVIVLLAVGALAVLAFMGNAGAGQAGAALGGTSAPAASSQGTSGQGTDGTILCMDVAPQARLAAYYIDTSSNDKVTQVATNAYVCSPGATSCISKTTATSGFNTTSTGEVGCLDTVDFIAGDEGTTYYYGHSGAAKVTGQVFTPGGVNGLAVMKSGSATYKLADASAASYGWATTKTYNWTLGGAGSGGESQDISVRVQSPSKPSVFGDLGYAMCFIFNSNNFTSIKPADSNGLVTQPLAHVKATATLDTVQCYDMGILPSGGTQETTVYMKAKSGVTPSSGTTVAMYLVDYTSTLYNGQLIPSYETRDGTQTDIGKADVGAAAVVTIST